jgi:hypothetical protein
LGGYVKYLFSRSELPGDGTAYDHLLHARLNTRWFPLENLSGILELRARAFYGGTVEHTPGFADQLGHDAGFGKLGALLWNQRKSVGYGEIDRMYLNWVPGEWQVTAGRQRIAWGTNLVWNPIDLFNPLSVLDFDYEERPAVDAVRIQYYTGQVSKVELAVKPGTASSGAITAGQWTANAWGYDFHLLGGWKKGGWFGGGGWAGDIEGAGFRGEFLISEIPERFRVPGDASVMVSCALSGDYTFPSSLYLHTEALLNTQGVTSEAALARPRALGLSLLSPARWSIFQEVAFDVSPLVRADGFAIINPIDGSYVGVPNITWSVVTNFDLTVFGLFFHGDPLTEYGQLGTAVYLRGKWSF